ncbi:YeiH family protein [Bacillus solimangrovi]|uniref:Sulfate exporter family transporter n=1 Tax=Bacillus solimangrovi TaxID=1305675 RepID=A0A1E5LJR4_9BACI|nr:YeiH family protein [Bacillus solimangrovi]OEH94332.1 hypothetical protein BFG57_08740 [Bacillus solimangrovi]
MSNYYRLVPGIALSLIVSIIAILTQQIGIIDKLHINSLIIAILIGMIVRNVFKLSETFLLGVQFTYKKLLRLSVVLLGFKLSILQVYEVGIRGIIIIILSVSITFIVNILIARKLKIQKETAILIGSGCSICGASAIAGTATVIDAKEKEITLSVATITIFGTIAMLSYPFIFQLLHLSEKIYGVWAGASIHEVAQVVAAGFIVGDEAGEYATLVKLTRVLMLIPTLFFLSMWQSKQIQQTERKHHVSVPLFVTGFIIIVLINSLQVIPNDTVQLINLINEYILLVSMSGLGLVTSLAMIRDAGMKPMYLTFVTSICISATSYALIYLFYL